MADAPEKTVDPAVQIADTLEKIGSTVEGLSDKVEGMQKEIDEKSKAVAPWLGGKAPAFIEGELENSRSFSFGRLMKAQVAINNGQNPDEHAKNEMEFCRRVGAVYEKPMAIPLSADYLSDSGDNSLAKEWRDMQGARGALDYDELAKIYTALGKDLTFRTSSTGGTMVSMPRQGELIELLRAGSWTTGAGFREVPLPANGSIRYPKVTGGVTISSYAEAEASTESTPATSEVLMEAKGYSGFVEITEQFLKFADTVAGDAFVRQEMADDTTLKIDRDIIDGPGGKSIQGLSAYGGVTSLTASTEGANGNTVAPKDLDLLLATMADANVPVDRGAVFLMRAKLWAALKHRENSGSFTIHNAAESAYGGAGAAAQFSGTRILTNSQVPNTRAKGGGTDLTMIMAIVGSEILMGRAGAMEIKMTDSHGSNFSSGILSLRGTVYCDVVPRHEASIGLIDTLLNA